MQYACLADAPQYEPELIRLQRQVDENKYPPPAPAPPVPTAPPPATLTAGASTPAPSAGSPGGAATALVHGSTCVPAVAAEPVLAPAELLAAQRVRVQGLQERKWSKEAELGSK